VSVSGSVRVCDCGFLKNSVARIFIGSSLLGKVVCVCVCVCVRVCKKV